jgi:hypothetical protein
MGRGVSTRATKQERESLREWFDDYFRGDPNFSHVTGMKFREYDGHYVVLRVERPGQHPFYVDAARAGESKPWQCQNDAIEMTEKQWNALSIPAECDWFEIPEEEES